MIILLVPSVTQILFFAYLGRAAGRRGRHLLRRRQRDGRRGRAGPLRDGGHDHGRAVHAHAVAARRLAREPARALPRPRGARRRRTAPIVAAFAFVVGSLILDVSVPASAARRARPDVLVTAFACTGLGIVNASIGLRWRETALLSNLLLYFLLLAAGVNVPLDLLPGWLSTLAQVHPRHARGRGRARARRRRVAARRRAAPRRRAPRRAGVRDGRALPRPRLRAEGAPGRLAGARVTLELVVADDPEAAAAEVARLLTAVAASGGSIALSGGSTPRRAYELAAELEPDWSRVDAWLCDERCVPPDDERANVRLVRETLVAGATEPPVSIRSTRCSRRGRRVALSRRPDRRRRSTSRSWASAATATRRRCFPDAPSLDEDAALARPARGRARALGRPRHDDHPVLCPRRGRSSSSSSARTRRRRLRRAFGEPPFARRRRRRSCARRRGRTVVVLDRGARPARRRWPSLTASRRDG